MSTKIYDGLIATDPNVWETTRRIRAVIEPLFTKKYEAAVKKAEEHKGESYKDVFDLMLTGTLTERWDRPIPSGTWEIAREVYELIDDLRVFPVRTFSSLDFGYSVTLMENGLGKELPSLVLVYSEKAGDEFRAALEAEGIVTEYGYWNNTDEPENLPEGEWERRKNAWSFLNVPADEGLSIDMPSKTYFVGEYMYNQIKGLID